jgi:hypothetical protein
MLYYTQHAKDRMQERRITEKEVEYCIQNYHTSYTDKKGNPIYIAQLPSDRQIKVVVQANNPKVVITVADR